MTGLVLVFVPTLLAAIAAWTALPPAPSVPPDAGLPTADPGSAPPPGASHDVLLRSAAALAVAVGVVAMLGTGFGLLLGTAAGAGTWQLTGRMEPRSERRRRERLAVGLPHVVDLMAAVLSAGLAPAAAVEQIASAVEPPMRDELTSLAARLRLGVDPATAWRDLSTHPQLGPLGRCVHRAVESGASITDAMDRLAEDLRRDGRAEVENRARAVGVRAAVPLGLCMLPAFVLLGVVPLVAGSLPVVLGR